jgi:RimJ/RimL family protein N-acetyltransferase
LKPHELPTNIEGEKILLRKFHNDDAELIFNEIDSDRERLGKYLPWVEHIKILDDQNKYVRDSYSKWLKCEEFNYAMFLKASNTYVGAIGVHSINWKHEKAELGYWILGKYEGKGLMLEATNRLTQILFHQGFHRVQIRCDETNARSANVPERAGFTFEGMFVDDQKLAEAIYRSTLMFSKIKNQRP